MILKAYLRLRHLRLRHPRLCLRLRARAATLNDAVVAVRVFIVILFWLPLAPQYRGRLAVAHEVALVSWQMILLARVVHNSAAH